MPNYVDEINYGPLHYRIEKRNGKFRLWLNGCGIGRPRPDKPPGEVWEYAVPDLRKVRREVAIDASERLHARVKQSKIELALLLKALASTESSCGVTGGQTE